MKRKKSLVVVLIMMVLLLSGCTSYLTNNDKKRVVNDETGQAVVSNIICLPKDEKLRKIYEDNKDNLNVNYEELRECNEYSPFKMKYSGIWDSIFVKPLAWVTIKVGSFVGNYGLAVILIGILIRIILLPLSKKTVLQSENMKKAQPELNALQKKYQNITSQEQRMAMSTEMMMIYKKYGISPGGSCLSSFIQIPLLFAFYEAINRVPAIFEDNIFSLQLGTSPSVGIGSGNYLYILIIVLIILSTYFSFKNTMSSTSGGGDQAQQMKTMLIFMIVFILIASISLPTALALYWISSNVFMIAQNYILKRSLDKNKTHKNRTKEKVKEAKFVDKKNPSKKKGK